MSQEQTTVSQKQVPDLLVASIRFRGDREAIPVYLDRLQAQARPWIAGRPFSLHYVHNPKEPPDIEVCVPVSAPVTTPEVKSRLLEGGPMLCVTHTGPYDRLGEAWQQIVAYIRAHMVTISDEPSREIYLEDRTQHGDAADRYVTELQLTMMLPLWLDRLAEGTERYAGPDARRQVMAGSAALRPDGPIQEAYTWARDAMHRLDALVEDEQTRCDIVAGCAHRFPDHLIEPLRAVYEETGDLDAVLRAMESWPEWYESPWREGPTIRVDKIPYNPSGFESAENPVERRAQYCHCPAMKAAIRAQEAMPRTYCFCGAGWYVRLWEGILGQPVRVEMRGSVAQGDDCCAFAIHLPGNVLS